MKWHCRPAETIWLDYREAAREPKLLCNLSAVAAAGQFLWTASDEGRTIQCLLPAGSGYRLHASISLDQVFPELPGADDAKPAEADIESLDACGGTLWVSGSHCRVRHESHRKKGAKSGPR